MGGWPCQTRLDAWAKFIEANRILDLAAAVGAFLIVCADADLTSMSPWRGRPIVEPSQFASMVDAPAGHADGVGENCRALTVNARKC